MPVLAPVMTRTGSSATRRVCTTRVRSASRGASAPYRGSLPRGGGVGGPLRELLPEGLPPRGAARGLDPVHGAQAAGGGGEGVALVHPVRRHGRRSPRAEGHAARTAGGRRRVDSRGGGGARPGSRRRRA